MTTATHNGIKVATYFKANLGELLDPIHSPHYYGIRELETYCWMCRTDVSNGTKGAELGPLYPGLTERLSGASCVNLFWYGVDAISGREWRKELHRRFVHIFLYRHATEGVLNWRAVHGIRLGNKVTVPGPTVNKHAEINFIGNKAWRHHGEWYVNVLDALFKVGGSHLAWCLNDCHHGATCIHRVFLKPYRTGPSFILDYGFMEESGSWRHTLATQKKGEPLAFTARRAWDTLQRLKDPNAEPPTVNNFRGPGEKPAERRADHD